MSESTWKKKYVGGFRLEWSVSYGQVLVFSKGARLAVNRFSIKKHGEAIALALAKAYAESFGWKK